MTKNELLESLRLRLFGERATITDAYMYAVELLGNSAETATALHVLMNTIANEIEKMEV